MECEDLIIIQDNQRKDFESDLKKAIENGDSYPQDLIEKAKKDLAKLIKVVKVDKNGKKNNRLG
jgi:N-acetylglucosamine kinase-like BadF-type ATPase